MNKYFLLLLVVLALASCKTDEEILEPLNKNTLEYYVSQNTDRDTAMLIACAASELPTNIDFRNSMFFYPEEGTFEYKYFESTALDIIPEDFSKYELTDLTETLPVFNGYLRRFPHQGVNEERWAIITYKSDGSLHICDPIRIKEHSKPTIYAPELIEIDLTIPTEPVFSWEADTIQDNIIYFQVVSDSLGNLISGTYTYDKFWKFYDLSNVVLNIHDITPHPVLQPHTKYTFTLMGVSEDNWVHLAGQKEFVTE